jgi:hypothetical protein
MEHRDSPVALEKDAEQEDCVVFLPKMLSLV